VPGDLTRGVIPDIVGFESADLWGFWVLAGIVVLTPQYADFEVSYLGK